MQVGLSIGDKKRKTKCNNTLENMSPSNIDFLNNKAETQFVQTTGSALDLPSKSPIKHPGLCSLKVQVWPCIHNSNEQIRSQSYDMTFHFKFPSSGIVLHDQLLCNIWESILLVNNYSYI